MTTKLPNGTFLAPHNGGFRHLDRDGKTTLACPRNLRFRRVRAAT